MKLDLTVLLVAFVTALFMLFGATGCKLGKWRLTDEPLPSEFQQNMDEWIQAGEGILDKYNELRDEDD